MSEADVLVLIRYIWQGRVRGAYPTALVERASDRVLPRHA